jgi:hypothetical protein
LVLLRRRRREWEIREEKRYMEVAYHLVIRRNGKLVLV